MQTPTPQVTENMTQTKRRDSQNLHIIRAQYHSDTDNIPKANVTTTNSDFIISKGTSRHLNSGQSSVAFNVGAANSRVNKNFYMSGGSSGLRHSRLNNIAVVVSSSMTVKED